MSKYVSRNYLRQKWRYAKSDMENCLSVLEESMPDQVDEEMVERCKYGIIDNLQAIITELGG